MSDAPGPSFLCTGKPKTKVTTATATSTRPITTEISVIEHSNVNQASGSQASSTAVSGANNTPNEQVDRVTFADDGSAIYRDPTTCRQYRWSIEKNGWQADDGDCCDDNSKSLVNLFENEHYKWCSETEQWLLKPQLVPAPVETEHYRWDDAKKEWISKDIKRQADVEYSIDDNGQRIYTDCDGTVFCWDDIKSAWFPRLGEDFMVQYQLNYGFIDNFTAGEQELLLKEQLEIERKAAELKRMTEEAEASAAASFAGITFGKRKTAPEPPKWFDLDPELNTKVYVSNLPLDITLDEFTELMGKCGMIMRDPHTQKYKLKLYTEADGQVKGDGLCDYIKVESVSLALSILDDYDLRGNKIRVERAEFQMRGEYNPSLKPKRKKKDKENLQKLKEKLFDWRPEKMRGERSKNEKIVIIKNFFQPETFEKDVQLVLDYQNDLREECAKCGNVRKVVLYDRHPEGVAQVNMASPEEADTVIQMMNGRYFGQRKLSAEHWDGHTKYKIEESEIEVQQRRFNWDQYLEWEEAVNRNNAESCSESTTQNPIEEVHLA